MNIEEILDMLDELIDSAWSLPLTGGRWVRTTPTEQVLRCRCKEHRRLYMAITAQREGQQWSGKAAIYKDAGPIAERYRKTCRKMQENKHRHSTQTPV